MKLVISLMILALVFCVSGLSIADSIEPGPKPEVSIEKALDLAKKYASAKIKTEEYYIDRVWLGVPVGERERKWIVSWCASGAESSQSKGWFIVAVDMKGNVSKPSRGVQWTPKNEGNSKKNELPDLPRLSPGAVPKNRQ